MLILSIYHSIFLTEEEIQTLVTGEQIDVIGASLPVWYQNGNTSEPAEEVFCRYTLTNKPGTFPIKVKQHRDGYIINVPQMPEDYVAPIVLDNEQWLSLSPDEREAWYSINQVPNSAKNLLPLSQRGAEYLYFKEFKRTKNEKQNTTMSHQVEIRTMKWLLKSFS